MKHDGVPSPQPFVLVHGGRHGGWCWRRVAPLLQAAGHEVLRPTLTGLGERSHLLGPGIGLETHVRDVCAVHEFEDLHDVVLVGHSYGGMVVAGAMEHVADRVAFVVLLDAHLPRTGESIFDLTPPDVVARLEADAARAGDGWLVPATDARFWGIDGPGDLAWVNPRITPQPLRTYRDPVRADRVWTHPGMYVECDVSVHRSAGAARALERCHRDPSFHHRVLRTGHEPMVTAPAEVAGVLLEAAALAAAHIGGTTTDVTSGGE